ncbi:MAG TPA: hypothetical protein VFP84_31160 [Kofleriaceae bacterium]|nr:hypothetical protein [Kofleriaceae bacterium]
MNKLLTTVGLAIGLATASMLAGCNLYFGNDHGDRSGTNGGGTGGGGSSGSGVPGGPGFECKDNTQCSAGCFCAEDGTCTEAGFCGKDSDCGDGFHCDVARSSCEPDAPPAAGCKVNTDCQAGSVCDSASGSCTATCKCTSDADAVKQGAAFCDEARGTCGFGSDPNGVCNGAVTCTAAKPTCGEGQVATVANGCYTGQCEAINACAATPQCTQLQHEDDCTARAADCTAVSEGHGCTRADGSACHTGDTDCKCTSFTYQACEAKGGNAGPTRVIFGE